MKLHVLSSRWYIYILSLELWEVPVRKKSKIVGALLVGSRSCVLFLQVETNSHFMFPLTKPVRLETRRSRVRPPQRSATFFRGD